MRVKLALKRHLMVNESFTGMMRKIFGLLKLHGIKAVSKKQASVKLSDCNLFGKSCALLLVGL